MDVYGGNYANPPASVEQHNERMNKSMVGFQTNRVFICPDCYLPIKYCVHLWEPDLAGLFRKGAKG